MEFRPCIDIHNGKVKQIVGSTLRDDGAAPQENFVSEKSAAEYAALYARDGLKGGHIVLLNKAGTPEYAASEAAALAALKAYPGGMQIGGGIRPDNAKAFLDAGASHVIVTSYIFSGGKILWDHLKTMEETVGRKHLVLDVSCKAEGGIYYIVTDRWQKRTDVEVNAQTLEMLAPYCDEFLIHAADVEGKQAGIDAVLVRQLAQYRGCPVTYAGGVGSVEDIAKIRRLGNGQIHVTIGSALDIFGGKLPYRDVIAACVDESV